MEHQFHSESEVNSLLDTTPAAQLNILASRAPVSRRDIKLNDRTSSCIDMSSSINHNPNVVNYLKCSIEEKEEEFVEADKRMATVNKKARAQKGSHFRIDWRQLSYHQKPTSFMSECFNRINIFSETTTVAENKKSYGDKINNLDSESKSEASSLIGGTGLSSVGNRKRILNSLDGCFRSGELSAILGPSGAGKSTFLSTLFGSKQESAYGYTKVTWLDENGSERLESKNGRRSLRIAFLPQHDHLLHHLTVYETLMFASKIKNHDRVKEEDEELELKLDNIGVEDRLSKKKSKKKKKKKKNFHQANVKRVAKMLKLTDCLNTRCGKLSGGQYKRVSIGQELLSEPDVIILDEPTSGLDAMTCLTTIQTLKSIVTKHPMSIILTIHQPDNDVFNLFDNVYVIAQGGMAIYEGPPNGIIPTMAQCNLFPPRANYNPARFIVENAFVPEPAYLSPDNQTLKDSIMDVSTITSSGTDDIMADDDRLDSTSGSDTDSDLDDNEAVVSIDKKDNNYFKRSFQSLTDTITGKEIPSFNFNKRDTIKKPLLNIGIRTLDGQLITSEHLAVRFEQNNKPISDSFTIKQLKKIDLLKRLNEMQKSKYHLKDDNDRDTVASTREDDINTRSGNQITLSGRNSSVSSPSPGQSCNNHQFSKSSAKSDYSSGSAYSSDHCDREKTLIEPSSTAPTSSPSSSPSSATTTSGLFSSPQKKSTSLDCLQGQSNLLMVKPQANKQAISMSEMNNKQVDNHQSNGGAGENMDDLVVNLPDLMSQQSIQPADDVGGGNGKLRRKFDKRLSAKHNCSNQTGYPILYHSLILTHRTWLSIIRDPVFFGIQFCMHTMIPVCLASVFGSVQEEGCPRLGNFDLVDFAYSDSENLIQTTIKSIRQSIGNIGIVFFEMFVICFAINCITALVFPSDMFVLLKEYRNGWYSLRSYFIGRTLADLPIPVVLHSIAISILYFMTGQPIIMWRYVSLLVLVILASLVAQSVGLTIGAILMKSSQSAVLAAAGIVAPFFAVSGFIVRIHTLPAIAQLTASGSYLYHLLNGFIIIRYGFGRCECSEDDFVQEAAHQIPANLHTMASMWIGTFSNEYSNSASVKAAIGNSSDRTNIDPNIDIVDKMMTAFKMANSYGHQINDCNDVLPYAMLDFNQRDQDIYYCFIMLILMVIISRFVTFVTIYYKIRSFA